MFGQALHTQLHIYKNDYKNIAHAGLPHNTSLLAIQQNKIVSFWPVLLMSCEDHQPSLLYMWYSSHPSLQHMSFSCMCSSILFEVLGSTHVLDASEEITCVVLLVSL